VTDVTVEGAPANIEVQLRLFAFAVGPKKWRNLRDSVAALERELRELN
jgi:hypothetical protein